jgi:hypothetical protein
MLFNHHYTQSRFLSLIALPTYPQHNGNPFKGQYRKIFYRCFFPYQATHSVLLIYFLKYIANGGELDEMFTVNFDGDTAELSFNAPTEYKCKTGAKFNSC